MTEKTRIKDDYEENKEKDKIIYVQCVNCKCSTRHKILCLYDCSYYYDSGSIASTTSDQIIQCQGCMNISFRHLSWCIECEVYDDDNGILYDDGKTEILYPQRSDNLQIKKFTDIPKQLEII